MNDTKIKYYSPELMKKIDKIILSTEKFIMEKEMDKLGLDKNIACLQEEKYYGNKCKECSNYEKYCKNTDMPALYQKKLKDLIKEMKIKQNQNK